MEETLRKIYENDDYIVIDKPAGLTVNRSKTTAFQGTLQDLLEAQNAVQQTYDLADSVDARVAQEDQLEQDLIEEFEATPKDVTEFILRAGIVHRLDKDTSGVLVVAKNEETFLYLQKQFKERQTSKVYLAVVYGTVGEDLIEIDAPIKRHPASRIKMAVVAEGKPALTRIEKLKVIDINGNTYTILKVMPKTGRTHQIRVHLTAFNHPIVGDELYAPHSLLEKSRENFPRLMLHANILGFYYPTKDNYVEYISPIPKEFQF